MALALAQYEDVFQLVRGYLKGRQRGLPFWVQCGLCLYVYRQRVIVPLEGGLYIRAPEKSCGPNMLDELLKDFIVIRADLPWQWVKRLITSDERVNHDSWVLGILNANRKIRKRTDTDVAFTREYSRVSIFHRERECTN